jgi:galactose mutarotase-like enzyme
MRPNPIKADGLEGIDLGSSGGLRAAFAPGANLILHSLTLAGRELLAQNDGLSGYAQRGATMGVPLLYPWANRLSAFRYRAAGRLVVLDRDHPAFALDPNGEPIHGAHPNLLRWEVLGRGTGDDGAWMRAHLAWERSHTAFGLFPFPHRLEYHAVVTQSTVRITVLLESTENQPVPVCFGFHPYLRILGGSRTQAQITLPVTRRLVLDELMIPTGETDAIEPGPRALGDSVWDDGFRDVEAGARFLLSGGDGQVSLRFLRGYPFAQVYAPAGSDFVCFEPMTAPTNALVRGGPDLQLVAPGETYEAGFEISVAP